MGEPRHPAAPALRPFLTSARRTPGKLRPFALIAGSSTRASAHVSLSPVRRPIVYVTQAWQQMCGYRMCDAVGRNPRLTQGEYSDSDTLRSMSLALRQQQACKVRLVNYRGGSNTTFWNCLSVHPIFHGGKLVLFAARLQDYSYQLSRLVSLQPAQFCKAPQYYQRMAHVRHADMRGFARPCAFHTGRKLLGYNGEGGAAADEDRVLELDEADDDDDDAMGVSAPELHVKRLGFSGIVHEPEYLLERLRDDCARLNLPCEACELEAGGAELMRLQITVPSSSSAAVAPSDGTDLRLLVHVMPQDSAGQYCITLTRLQGNTFQFHSIYRALRQQLADLLPAQSA